MHRDCTPPAGCPWAGIEGGSGSAVAFPSPSAAVVSKKLWIAVWGQAAPLWITAEQASLQLPDVDPGSVVTLEAGSASGRDGFEAPAPTIIHLLAALRTV